MSDIDISPPITAGGTPVVKRQRIGDKFVGAILDKPLQRQRMKTVDGVSTPMVKRDGKPAYELVIECIALPGTTAQVGLGDDTHVPEPGERCRLIIHGKSFAEWIEALRNHRGGKQLKVGDVVKITVDHAQAYDASGQPKGGPITDQAAADALPRSTAVGYYGPLSLHEHNDHAYLSAAQAAHRALHDVELVDTTPASVVEDPW